MPNFYCFNATKNTPHSPNYPGVRFDTTLTDPLAALKAWMEIPGNADPSDLCRVAPGSSLVWATGTAQPPVTGVSAAAPALPAVGT